MTRKQRNQHFRSLLRKVADKFDRYIEAAPNRADQLEKVVEMMGRDAGHFRWDAQTLQEMINRDERTKILLDEGCPPIESWSFKVASTGTEAEYAIILKDGAATWAYSHLPWVTSCSAVPRMIR